ncbi:hypothetical protein Glove_209g111 [Diversispora epigaea]|uniref:Uncharacterized protein n=1 Tax=Diversispora epigaea TaxID=1348612 RepID=A0A397IIR6_9GLOM|nr:hypothetical protein Glove_209g111 [Diversispora epigaea]
MVLTEDMILRMYDVFNNLEEPEQQFFFSQNSSQDQGVSFSTEETKAVSFCFGQSQEGWGNLVVYVLSNNGDVYSMCPIIPQKCVFHKFFLDQLAYIVQKKFEETERISKEFNYHSLLNQYRQQLDWVSSIYKQITPNSDKVIYNNPLSTRKKKPKLQGPYLIQPEPVELSTHPTDASDILCLATEPLSVIVIAHNNGRVDICLEVDKVEALWQDSVEIDHPILILYECIDLGFTKDFVIPTSWRSERITNSMNHPSLLNDPVYPDIFYVYHFAGAHGIILKGWLNELGNAMKDVEDEKMLETFLEKKKRSDVNWIASSLPSDPDPLVGMIVISNEAELSYSILLLTSSLRLVCHELAIRKSLVSTNGIRMNDLYYSNKSSYKPLDPNFLEKVMNHHGLSHQPILMFNQNKAGSATGSSTIGEVDYKCLSTILDLIEREGNESWLETDEISRRFKQQATEFQHQIQEIYKLKKNLDEFRFNRFPEISNRMQRLKERQSKIESRAYTYIQKLLYVGDPVRGEFEKSYCQTLARINQEIEGENGLKVKIKKLDAYHKTLKDDYHLLSPRNSKKSRKFVFLSGSQLHKVEEALAEEMDLIDETNRKMGEANNKINKIQKVKSSNKRT